MRGETSEEQLYVYSFNGGTPSLFLIMSQMLSDWNKKSKNTNWNMTCKHANMQTLNKDLQFLKIDDGCPLPNTAKDYVNWKTNVIERLFDIHYIDIKQIIVSIKAYLTKFIHILCLKRNSQKIQRK